MRPNLWSKDSLPSFCLSDLPTMHVICGDAGEHCFVDAHPHFPGFPDPPPPPLPPPPLQGPQDV